MQFTTHLPCFRRLFVPRSVCLGESWRCPFSFSSSASVTHSRAWAEQSRWGEEVGERDGSSWLVREPPAQSKSINVQGTMSHLARFQVVSAARPCLV